MNIKLHEPHRRGPSDDHDEIWELIPWYVNGSLPDDRLRTVESHVQTCGICAREIHAQQALADDVAEPDAFDIPLDRSWETLRAQAMADIAARTPQAPALHRRLSGRINTRIASLAGAAAVACAALFVVVDVQHAPDGDFVTLTSAPEGQGQNIRFQSAGQPDAAALADLGVLSVTGPSESGVYTATIAEDADPEEIARAMMARDNILFAAPEPSK